MNKRTDEEILALLKAALPGAHETELVNMICGDHVVRLTDQQCVDAGLAHWSGCECYWDDDVMDWAFERY